MRVISHYADEYGRQEGLELAAIQKEAEDERASSGNMIDDRSRGAQCS